MSFWFGFTPGFIAGVSLMWLFGVCVGLGHELGICKHCGEPYP